MGLLLKNNKFTIILIAITFLIKLAVMPVSAHSDLFAVEIFPQLLFKHGIVDIFSYLNKFNLTYFYPPLSYYFFAVFEFFLQFLSPSYLPWLDNMRSGYLSGLEGQVAAYFKSAPNPYLLKDLFIAKIPLLIFDIASTLLILKMVKEKILKKGSIIFWVANPVIFYVTYLFGQFDVIVLFFILWGFYLVRFHTKLAMLVFGIAGALKTYPFIIVLPIALIYGKDIKERIKLTTIAFMPFFISIIPTLTNSPQLVLFTFFPKNIFHYKQPLEGWEKYSQLVKYGSLAFSYLIILFTSSLLRLKDKWRTAIGISLVVVLIALTMSGRTHFHYLIWEMPLFLLFFKNNLKFSATVLIIQIFAFASYKLLASQFQFGLFSPLNPEYFSSLPTINSLINLIIPYRIISTLGFFVFSLINFYLILNITLNLIFKSESLNFKKRLET